MRWGSLQRGDTRERRERSVRNLSRGGLYSSSSVLVSLLSLPAPGPSGSERRDKFDPLAEFVVLEVDEES
jgi:hypothetical protein